VASIPDGGISKEPVYKYCRQSGFYLSTNGKDYSENNMTVYLLGLRPWDEDENEKHAMGWIYKKWFNDMGVEDVSTLFNDVPIEDVKRVIDQAFRHERFN
jgi:hypothetical protein